MATRNNNTGKGTKASESKEVATRGGKGGAAAGKAVATSKPKPEERDQLPAEIGNMADFAGGGMENLDRDSVAIPFLAIMQKMSPQVDKDSDAVVEDAEVGDLLITTTNELFKDEDGVDIVLCGFRRAYLRWADKDSGGGFKGELSVEEVARERALGQINEDEGKLYADNGDIIRDTRIHYVLVVRPDGTFIPAVLSCASTQIKKSKLLLAQVQNFIAKDSNGKAFTPPSFGHIFHAETVAESNDKGTWRGWKFTRKGFVNDRELFQAAVLFADQVRGEKVRVDYSQADGGIGAAESSDGKM